MISAVFNCFSENCQRCYRPSPEMTIDEQLFPTKARCPFTQYLPSKPDRFGIKFWIFAEVDSKYCFEIMPCLGRDEERVETLGTHVVMKLSEPLWYKGYNITTDNFFYVSSTCKTTSPEEDNTRRNHPFSSSRIATTTHTLPGPSQLVILRNRGTTSYSVSSEESQDSELAEHHASWQHV